MMEDANWQARWIGDGRKNPEADKDYFQDDRMPLFRRDFQIKKSLQSARLYISGLGYYEAYLNGRKSGDHMLDPGWTTYRKQVQYVVHDIGPMLKIGRNVIGVMLGNGWWNPLPLKFFGRWDLRQYQQTGRPIFRAVILLRYKDGTEEWIRTDEHWKVAPGPIIRNNVYLGEQYDARLEQKNWCSNGTLSADWKMAVPEIGPEGRLTPQVQPPIRITKRLRPVAIKEQGKDTFLVDMGQNFAGVIRLQVQGKAGTAIHIRYGETLFPDGRLNVMTTAMTQIKKGGIPGGPGAPETAWQEDVYILKGLGKEAWNPRFTFHGFRYVEITGWPGTPTVNDFEGLRMNSDVEPVGRFECSNALFNQLHEAVQWTFLSNIFSVQSDCPGREKMGYGADMVASAETFLFNYDMANFYGKAIQDFANEQRQGGGITEIAPFTGIADRGYGDDSGPLGWQLAFGYLQQQLYEFYGDKKVIESQYEAVKKQLEFLRSKAIDGLFYWDISDHESLDPKPESFSASCFYFHHALLAAKFASILGQKDDELEYNRMANAIRRSIVAHYEVPGTGRFDLATQAAQSMALWYGLANDSMQAFKQLESEIHRHNDHLSTGIFGTKMMFDVLRRYHRNELAYAIASQRTFPGWGYMLENGATTLWETWAYPGTVYSNNHPMFGSVDEWFYRSLLGINAAAPGYRKILIHPQPAGDLRFAKGSFQSVMGEITSSWKKFGDQFELQVSIPVNTTAEIKVPCKPEQTVLVNGNKIVPAEIRDGFALLRTGSGNYLITVN